MSPASIKDVARLAGVSVGTVSNVLNRPEKVSPATIERVTRVVEEVGFVRNDAARQLRAGRSTSIGLIVLDVRNPFFTELARGVEDEASRHQLSVILGNSDEEPARESAYLDLFDEHRVRGVLVSPIGDVTTRLDRLRAHGTAAVIVERDAEGTGFSSVSVDNVAGGYLAARHLLGAGRRRLAFVGARFEIRQVADRLEGVRRAVSETPGALLEVVSGESLTVLEGRRLGQELALRPPAERPDAVLAANDLLAIGSLQAFILSDRVHVPEDVAVVGYDDIDFASAAIVPLTSVRQPSQLMGSTAVRLLLEESDSSTAHPQNIVFQPELVVRDSSG